MTKKLDKIFNKSKRIIIDNNSKIVIMSDCHRGAGDKFDNFIKNQNIYEYALNFYYNRGYTYIELGDGDDMWEVKEYDKIVKVNLNSFKVLKKFHDLKRFYMIYGNHDIVKKNIKVLKNCFYKYYDANYGKYELLLNNLNVYESLILDYMGYDIFLLHGHQVDFLNSSLWRLSRFFVKYLWRGLEYIGAEVPTGYVSNNKISNSIERRLNKWSIFNNKILISGHTHNAIYPVIGEGLYFNDGSCIHPDGITCIEIENGNLTLVKWAYKVTEDKVFSIKRSILNGDEPIVSFYK